MLRDTINPVQGGPAVWEGEVAKISQELRAMYSPEQQQQMDAVIARMKADPTALDTHSREVRNQETRNAEQETNA